MLVLTGDPDVVAEDETAHGGDDTGHRDEGGEVPRILLLAVGDYPSHRRHLCSLTDRTKHTTLDKNRE